MRRVGVNAFGYGGTNAHCILENADATKTKHGAHKSAQQSSPPANGIDGHHEGDDRPHLLVFSAHDKITLERNLNAYATMSQKTQVDLLDLAYTLATRRSKHRVRAFTVCREQFAISGLQSAFGTAVQADGPATVAFVFTGNYESHTHGIVLICYTRSRRTVAKNGCHSSQAVSVFCSDNTRSRCRVSYSLRPSNVDA